MKISDQETFSKEQVQIAIKQFLEWGEKEYKHSQEGYFSGDGWAARCLRWHLEQLKNEKDDLKSGV